MKTNNSFTFEDECLKSYVDGNLGIIKIKDHVYNLLTDLSESGSLTSIYESGEKNPNIKVILLMNNPGSSSGLKSKTSSSTDITDKGDSDILAKNFSGGYILPREVNFFYNFILKGLEFEKLIVLGLQGNIVSPFFGASLAADFRFVSQNTIFNLNHTNEDFHPTGALPFFLPRFLNYSKAFELLIKGGKINANEALEMGLVTSVFPGDNFENECIKEAHNLCDLNMTLIKKMKKLTCSFKEDLQRYFECEMHMIH